MNTIQLKNLLIFIQYFCLRFACIYFEAAEIETFVWKGNVWSTWRCFKGPSIYHLSSGEEHICNVVCYSSPKFVELWTMRIEKKGKIFSMQIFCCCCETFFLKKIRFVLISVTSEVVMKISRNELCSWKMDLY